MWKQTEIEIKTERYVHVEDWKANELLKNIWCHQNCFNKAMNRDLTQLEKQAQSMLSRAGNMLNQIMPQEEVVKI